MNLVSYLTLLDLIMLDPILKLSYCYCFGAFVILLPFILGLKADVANFSLINSSFVLLALRNTSNHFSNSVLFSNETRIISLPSEGSIYIKLSPLLLYPFFNFAFLRSISDRFLVSSIYNF